MLTARTGHSCVIIDDIEGNKKVLVVGGFTEDYKKLGTEILDIATLTWYTGMDKNFTTHQSELVAASASSNNVAFQVGGWPNNDLGKKIFGLTNDLREWKEMTGSFTTTHLQDHVALKLPESMIEAC